MKGVMMKGQKCSNEMERKRNLQKYKIAGTSAGLKYWYLFLTS